MQVRIYGVLAVLMFTLAWAAAAQDSAGDPLDLTNLPIGDYKISTTPQVGYVYRCGNGQANTGIGGAQVAGPWIRSDSTFDFTAKAVVDGAVDWAAHRFTITLEGDVRRLEGNNLPNHPTGVYPIPSSDDAYQYDRNPNRIAEQSLTVNLPALPTPAAQPGCLTPGAIAVLTSGVVVFDGLDALNRDAVAHETQDGCQGHPQVEGAYHYHNLTDCLEDPGDGHSALVGYALDGFGLYGVRGETGEPLTNADLDECHGHTHLIEWDGQMVELYHYHATYEYPYTIGCFRGEPAATELGGGEGGMVQGAGGQQPPPPPGGQQPPPQGGQPPPPPGGQQPPPPPGP
jgi:hypothetical protein